MKKLILVSIAVLLAAGLASAQLPSFGIKGGLNMANITGTDAPDDAKSKMGAIGGAFVCVDLMVLKIQPELLYSQKGTKGEYLGISYTDKIDYLEIPILMKFPFGKIIVPSIYMGPSVGILLSAKETAQSQTLDFKDLCNSNDFGLVFGAEVKTPAKVSVEARYNMGLGKLFKPILGFQPDVKNSTISVMLGYYMF